MDALQDENLPAAAQSLKERAAFYITSWSGRISLINGCVFILMSIAAKSLFMPSESVLLQFGAKEPVLIACGEWWRLITPVFVHIGIIHFIFNFYALRSIGPQIEAMLSPRWFLVIYLAAGIAGNIASNIANLRIGAGASGAIFGLIGSGLVIENYIKKALKRSQSPFRGNQTYTTLALLNLGLGALIPGIDNAAHLGGLVSGVLLTMAQLRLRENRLVAKRPAIGLGIIGGFLLISGAAVFLAMNKHRVAMRFAADANVAWLEFRSAKNTDDKLDAARESYHDYTNGLRLEPENHVLKFGRGRLLILVGDTEEGMKDLIAVAINSDLRSEFVALAAELRNEKRDADATLIDSLSSGKL